jgi:hypothetical protein
VGKVLIGRVELPINRYRDNTVDPARDDNSFFIRLAPQHRDAFTTETAKEGRIDDDDVILVTAPRERERVFSRKPPF